MRNLGRRARILILIFVTCFAALSLTYESILTKIGHFLVYEQDPQKVDVIVVLNGRDIERALAAVDLYNEGYADLIVLARGPKQPGCDEFWKKVGDEWDSTIFFQRAIQAMGIPDHAFRLIGDGVTSTYDEAKTTKNFLAQNGYRTILLVTSKWHSRRAFLTFKSVLKDHPEVQIVVHPSKYDPFNPDVWWKNEPHAESVFREYARLIYYSITYRISPFNLFL